jgi:hypothetical protein
MEYGPLSFTEHTETAPVNVIFVGPAGRQIIAGKGYEDPEASNSRIIVSGPYRFGDRSGFSRK